MIQLMNKKSKSSWDKGQFLLYQTPDGESKIEVKLQGRYCFAVARPNGRNYFSVTINEIRHIKNVLKKENYSRGNLLHTCNSSNEGNRHVERQINTCYYNLDTWRLSVHSIVACSSV